MPSLDQTSQSAVQGVLLLCFITEYLSQAIGTSQPSLTFLEGTCWDHVSPPLSFMGTKGQIQMEESSSEQLPGTYVCFLRCQNTGHAPCGESKHSCWCNPTRAPCHLQGNEKELMCTDRDITHPHRHKYNTVTGSSSGDFQPLIYWQREPPYSERLLEAKELQTMKVEACPSVGQVTSTILTPLTPARFPAG